MELKTETINDFKYHSFFSEYLPDCFSILPIENCDIFNIVYSESLDLIPPYKYTMSKFSNLDYRRDLFLPEVISYINLVKYMIDKHIINDICELSKNNSHSFSQIIQQSNEFVGFIRHENSYNSDEVEPTPIFSLTEDIGLSQEELDRQNNEPSTYIQNIIAKIKKSMGSKGILHLDISQFYGSIYTHYLAAIQIGFDNAMQQYNKFKANQRDVALLQEYLVYKELDNKIRKMNKDETKGILVGPPISNYISEAFLTQIDLELESKYPNFVRYVDDYEIFIYDENDKSKILNIFTETFDKYNLSINESKTDYKKFPYYIIKNLNAIFKKNGSSLITPEQMIEMFTEFFVLEDSGVKGAIRYLIKSIANKNSAIIDKQIYTAYLLNVLTNDGRSLIKVCELIIKDSTKIEITDEFIKIIINILRQLLKQKRDVEVVWLLYLYKTINSRDVSLSLIKEIASSENDLAKIVIIHEFDGHLDSELRNIIKENAKSWILIYQLFLLDYINKDDFENMSGIRRNVAFYNQLKRNHFSFYRVN